MAAKGRQSVTIRHVAAEAGVSLQTVSRVINNEPNVRPAMIERVKAAVTRLGYVPSIAAQRMGGSRSYLLLALNDRDRTIEGWRSREGTDWVDQMLLGGMLRCAEGGYRLILELVDTHTDHVEREVMGALQSLRPDGVILTPPHSDNPAITELLEGQKVPFARIGSVKQGPGLSISMDDHAAARRATAYLLSLGHRRIGFITGDRHYSLSAARLEGYRAAMREGGCGDTSALEAEGDFGFESGIAAARRLLTGEAPATAILASSDQMAIASLRVAEERGLGVPDDLSVISFDDTPIVRFSRPPLTAIVQPIAATAARAAEWLMAAQGDGSLSAEPEVMPCDLTVRESTGPAPAPAVAV